MLGQANTDLILKILQACLNGQTAAALDLFATADACGAEPDVFIADMLDNIHLASLIAGGAGSSEQPEAQSQMLTAIATAGIARLGRAWQLLLNGHREIKDAPNPKTAAQMVLIRLAHIAPMPVQLCQCFSAPLIYLGDQPGLAAFLAHESGQVTQKIFLFNISIYLHFQLTIFKTDRAQMLAQACGQNFLSGLI